MKVLRVAACYTTDLSYRIIGSKLLVGCRKDYQALYCKFLELLSKAVDCKYKFVFSGSLSTPGNPIEDTDCRIEDMLRYNKSDVAAKMVFSYDASQNVAFSSPISVEGIKFAMKQREVVSKDLVILYPFQFSVWLCIMISLLLCGFLLSAMMYRNSTTKRNIKSVCGSILCCLEIFCGVRGFRIIRGTVKMEIFCALVILSMRILIYCFCSVFLSYLLAPIIAHPIKTFAELGRAAKLDKINTALLGNNSHVADQLRKSSETNEVAKNILDNYYRHIYEEISPLYLVMIYGYVLIAEELEIEMSDAYHEDIHTSDDSLSIQIAGLFYRKGFKDIETFNEAVLKILESGIMNYYRSIYIFNLRYHMEWDARQFRPIKEKGFKPISWLDLKGAFILCAVGNSLAIIVFICEKCFYKDNCNKRQTIKKRLCSA